MRTGLHANDTRDHAKILDYYERSQSRVFKTLVFHDDLLAELRAMGVTVIGRVYTDRQELGGQVAKDFLRKLLDNAARHPGVTYWEGYNEAFNEIDKIGRYAEFEIERMKALEAIGRKAAIACFSLGTPELNAWPFFRPALEHAKAHGHVLALHEYAGPYMQYFTRTPDGKNQWNHASDSFTGISTDPALYWNPALDGWFTLRYRMAYALFRTWGLGDLPLYITEGGIDDATPRPGPNGKGYKAFQDGVWDRLPGIGDYADQRRWYMWQASQDKYVGGVVDFGWEGTPTGWPDFDLSTDPRMVDRIIAREADLPIGHFGDAPVPVPPPPTPTPQPPPEATMLAGIDVSRWQGAMDWTKTKAAGVAFAWIKASEGTVWVDPQFKINVANVAGSGILWGAYHYYRNDVSPIAQARHFVATVAATGVTPGLVYALDFEDTTGRVDPRAMEAFALEVERLTGARPVAYTASWWWTRARLGAPQPWAARLALWIADYSPESVPLPATGEWSRWTILQHTNSGDGPKHGASSARIDLDRFDGTRDALLAAVGYTVPAGIDQARLWREARENQAVRLNPDSAIQRAIHGAGMTPTSNEWEFSANEQAQLAESLNGPGAAVFVWDRRTGRVERYNQP